MKVMLTCRLRRAGAIAALTLAFSTALAQSRQDPGRSLGTVTTQGNLIVLTLDEGVLGKPISST